MANLPALPNIEGGLIIDLYMHRSIQSDYVNDDYGDMNRLIQLGVKALDTALHLHFFRQRPILTAAQIADEVAAAISEAKLREWLAAYGIQKQYRGSATLLESPEDMYRFFHGFVGALYYRNGMPRVQAWISALIDPNAYNNDIKAERTDTGLPPLPNQASPAQNPTGNVLGCLNEAAMRRGLSATYTAVHEGPSHAPTWIVDCHISGIPRGIGRGRNQKQAKEKAATAALEAMGW